MPILLELSGVGAIVAGTLLAEVGDPQRFPTSDHFASYCGAAPVERGSVAKTPACRSIPVEIVASIGHCTSLQWSDYVWTVVDPGNSWLNKPSDHCQVYFPFAVNYYSVLF